MNEGYSISEAARQLGVSRPAVYRYIDKQPGRYTVTDEKGKSRITLHGLGLLSEAIRPTKRTQTIQAETDIGGVTNDTNAPVIEMSGEVLALQADVTLLQARLHDANALIESQRAQIATLETALAFAHEQVPKRLTGRVDGLWARIFRRGQRITNITSEV